MQLKLACSATGCTAAGLACLGVDEADVRGLEAEADIDVDMVVQSEPREETDSLRAISGLGLSISSSFHAKHTKRHQRQTTSGQRTGQP
jgi:hypothetical protein